MWTFVKEKLDAGLKVILLVVVDRQGSSPGKQGFKMAVSSDGTLAGSIGGGVMEYQMVELARELLAEGNMRAMLKRQVHDPHASGDRSGLICSGEQTHAFIALGESDLEVVEQFRKAGEGAPKGWLVLESGRLSFIPLDQGEDRPDQEEALAAAGLAGKGVGQAADGFIGGQTAGGTVGGPARSWHRVSDNIWKYTEAVGQDPCLYIFGGGHLSVPLSQVCRMLGFRVVVLDDREGLNTMETNVFAHEKRLVDYRDAGSLFTGDDRSYVVIMTVSHAIDQLVLGQMLDKPLKYLGMIGSRKKVQKIFESLKSKGASDDQLKRVDSPMGLEINSQTPAEIAISIAARIIQVKNA
jgi:xanthine dehydrogenase accessory factor